MTKRKGMIFTLLTLNHENHHPNNFLIACSFSMNINYSQLPMHSWVWIFPFQLHLMCSQRAHLNYIFSCSGLSYIYNFSVKSVKMASPAFSLLEHLSIRYLILATLSLHWHWFSCFLVLFPAGLKMWTGDPVTVSINLDVVHKLGIFKCSCFGCLLQNVHHFCASSDQPVPFVRSTQHAVRNRIQLTFYCSCSATSSIKIPSNIPLTDVLVNLKPSSITAQSGVLFFSGEIASLFLSEKYLW